MTPSHEIRADFDRETIVVYQAYPDRIADAALEAGTFVAPFSFERMTWIKPSFRWLMERSAWGRKSGQERTLAVRITRAGWEEALALAVPTHWERRVHATFGEWREAMEGALVHVQWDPERTAAGVSLPHRSIQIGLGRGVIRRFAGEWVREIRDLTPLVAKLRALRPAERDARRPPERPYPGPEELARRLGMA